MDETRRELRALYGSEKDIAIAFAKKARRTTAATRSGGRRVFQLSALGHGSTVQKSPGTDGRGGCTQPLTGLPPCGEALQRVRTASLGPPSLPLCADLGLLRLLDRNRAQGSRALREGKGPAQRARPEEVVHVPSGGTARTDHARHRDHTGSAVRSGPQAVRIGPRSCPKGIRGVAVHQEGPCCRALTTWEDKAKSSSSYASIRTLLRFWGTIVQ